MEIRLLSDHRNNLLAERTRMQKRLRWHLLALCPDLEQSLKPRTLDQPRQLERIDRRLRRLLGPGSARVRIARDEVTHVRTLTRQINQLELELTALIKTHRPQLLAETGCGPLTAAILIGHTAGAERFRSDASFARQAGVAPILCSSGQRDRHRLHRGGDRQLNHALHVIAITRARCDPATKAYLARKQAEGKSKREAIRCLKRHLARRFHHILAAPNEPRQHDRHNLASAPTSMPCLT
jgi:transposase